MRKNLLVKIGLIVLCLSMVLSLFACNDGEETTDDVVITTEPETTEPETTEPETTEPETTEPETTEPETTEPETTEPETTEPETTEPETTEPETTEPETTEPETTEPETTEPETTEPETTEPETTEPETTEPETTEPEEFEPEGAFYVDETDVVQPSTTKAFSLYSNMSNNDVKTGKYLLVKYKFDNAMLDNGIQFLVLAGTVEGNPTGTVYSPKDEEGVAVEGGLYASHVVNSIFVPNQDNEWHIAIIDLTNGGENHLYVPDENGDYVARYVSIQYGVLAEGNFYIDYVALADNLETLNNYVSTKDDDEKSYCQHSVRVVDGYYEVCVICGDKVDLPVDPDNAGDILNPDRPDFIASDADIVTPSSVKNIALYNNMGNVYTETGKYLIIKYKADAEIISNSYQFLILSASYAGNPKGTVYAPKDLYGNAVPGGLYAKHEVNDNFVPYQDGEWHIAVIDLTNNGDNHLYIPESDGSYIARYVNIQYGTAAGAEGNFYIDYFAMSESLPQLREYISQKGDLDKCVHSIITDDGKNCALCGNCEHITRSETKNAETGKFDITCVDCGAPLESVDECPHYSVTGTACVNCETCGELVHMNLETKESYLVGEKTKYNVKVCVNDGAIVDEGTCVRYEDNTDLAKPYSEGKEFYLYDNLANAEVKTGKYLLIKYKFSEANCLATWGGFDIRSATTAGVDGGSFIAPTKGGAAVTPYQHTVNAEGGGVLYGTQDGNWHIAVIDLTDGGKNSLFVDDGNGNYVARYVHFHYANGAKGDTATLSIDYYAFSDNVADFIDYLSTEDKEYCQHNTSTDDGKYCACGKCNHITKSATKNAGTGLYDIKCEDCQESLGSVDECPHYSVTGTACVNCETCGELVHMNLETKESYLVGEKTKYNVKVCVNEGCQVVVDEGSSVRYEDNTDLSKPYSEGKEFMLYNNQVNAEVKTGRFLLIKYKFSEANCLATWGGFDVYAATTAGADGGGATSPTKGGVKLTAYAHTINAEGGVLYGTQNNEWHIAVIDLTDGGKNSLFVDDGNGNYIARHVYFHYANGAKGTTATVYVDYFAFSDNLSDFANYLSEEEKAYCQHNVNDGTTCSACGKTITAG